MTSQHRELWERQEHERDERWHAFQAYRDMPLPRSLRRLGDLLDKDSSLLMRWSSADDWQQRISAWELEQDRQRREALRAGNVAAGERHASIAARGLDAVDRVAQAWLAKVDGAGGNEELKVMRFPDLSDLLVQSLRVLPRLVVAERLARGMSTENLEHSGSVDVQRERVADWTDDELDAFLLGATSAGVTLDDLDPETS